MLPPPLIEAPVASNVKKPVGVEIISPLVSVNVPLRVLFPLSVKSPVPFFVRLLKAIDPVNARAAVPSKVTVPALASVVVPPLSIKSPSREMGSMLEALKVAPGSGGECSAVNGDISVDSYRGSKSKRIRPIDRQALKGHRVADILGDGAVKCNSRWAGTGKAGSGSIIKITAYGKVIAT